MRSVDIKEQGLCNSMVRQRNY